VQVQMTRGGVESEAIARVFEMAENGMKLKRAFDAVKDAGTWGNCQRRWNSRRLRLAAATSPGARVAEW